MTNKFWNDTAAKLLEGRTIVKAQYMSTADAEDEGWEYGRAVVITLDNGLKLVPMSDDEGNDAGALLVDKGGDENILPVVRG